MDDESFVCQWVDTSEQQIAWREIRETLVCLGDFKLGHLRRRAVGNGGMMQVHVSRAWNTGSHPNRVRQFPLEKTINAAILAHDFYVIVLSQISASAHSRQNNEHSHLGVNIAGLTSGLLLDMASRAMRDGSEYDSRSGRSAIGEWRQQKKQSLHGTLAGHRPG